MARRTVPLTLDHLDALGEQGAPCRSCVFWETDAVRRQRLGSPEDRAEEKATWTSTVLREWGSCGRVAVVDGRPVGLLVYAPPAFVPGAAAFPTAPVSGDAVLMTSVWVHPDHARGGLGRLLVQGMARDLIQRGGIRAVEAFGRAHGGRATVVPGAGCAAPADFLARVGFRTHRAHPGVPRMRMDLRSALTWRDEVEAALERLVGVVRPTPAPAPDARVPAVRRDDGDT